MNFKLNGAVSLVEERNGAIMFSVNILIVRTKSWAFENVHENRIIDLKNGSVDSGNSDEGSCDLINLIAYVFVLVWYMLITNTFLSKLQVQSNKLSNCPQFSITYSDEGFYLNVNTCSN